MSLAKFSMALLEYAPTLAPAAVPLTRKQERRERRSAQRDQKVRTEHRADRQALPAFVFEGGITGILVAPVIYSLIVPFALLDAWVWAYQQICFRAWGIALVRRTRYFAYDHHKLAYLNGIEKLNCVYCAYANGVIAYVREVAGRTEQYWCPIRHARKTRDPHRHVDKFVRYGDAKAYKRELPAIRAALR